MFIKILCQLCRLSTERLDQLLWVLMESDLLLNRKMEVMARCQFVPIVIPEAKRSHKCDKRPLLFMYLID